MIILNKLIVDGFEIPVFVVDERGRFFCPYCKCIHTHGNIDGHRIAHCTKDDSPFKKTGYVIVTEEFMECIHHFIESHKLKNDFEGS